MESTTGAEGQQTVENKQQATQDPAATESNKADATANKEEAKQEKDEGLPDLQDPGVQKSTIMIQKAFFRKKNAQTATTKEPATQNQGAGEQSKPSGDGSA
mmetsp:Transcript_40771/g.47426  ORF Transcript_40771/g.47426 Transcript_40771/m.47426 type:complete len:101 (-) Transcript_40771:239-541(-)